LALFSLRGKGEELLPDNANCVIRAGKGRQAACCPLLSTRIQPALCPPTLYRDFSALLAEGTLNGGNFAQEPGKTCFCHAALACRFLPSTKNLIQSWEQFLTLSRNESLKKGVNGSPLY
jgi:hypothetical protein